MSGPLGNLANSLSQSGLAGKLIEALGPGVLGGLIEQLNQNGLGAKVNSWLGRGDNRPVTADEIRDALGNQKLQDLAKSLGIPAAEIADVLAKHLPAAVDQASAGGVLDGKPGAAGAQS